MDVTDLGLIAGCLGGGIGGGVGLFLALRALGFFQYLGGRKSSPLAVGKEILMEELLALNDDSRPYRIIRGEDTDLIAEWKIVDASWYGAFSKNRLKKAYRALLLLDGARHTVRCFEVLGSVNWSAGAQGLTPSVRYSKSAFGGVILFKKSYGVGYGLNNPKALKLGKVYEYKFDVEEIRGPIRATVLENEWEWVPVAARRHATYGKGRGSVVPLSLDPSFCTQCGTEILNTDNYCSSCGQKLR